jgi:hypothetical protein
MKAEHWGVLGATGCTSQSAKYMLIRIVQMFIHYNYAFSMYNPQERIVQGTKSKSRLSSLWHDHTSSSFVPPTLIPLSLVS